MGTKQVQMEFQVVADDGVSANVTVTVGGTQVFSGPINQTADVMPDEVFNDTTPFSLVQFDLDVENMPVPSGASNQYGAWVVPKDITVSVTGGSVTLQATKANYSATVGEVLPATVPPTWQTVSGTADTFVELRFASQPVFTPSGISRLNYDANVNTGPGSLLLLDGESVAYQAAMTYYSAA
jgi:hypothetical protein